MINLAKMYSHMGSCLKGERKVVVGKNRRDGWLPGDFSGINTAGVTAEHLIKSDCYIWQPWSLLSHYRSPGVREHEVTGPRQTSIIPSLALQVAHRNAAGIATHTAGVQGGV